VQTKKYLISTQKLILYQCSVNCSFKSFKVLKSYCYHRSLIKCSRWNFMAALHYSEPNRENGIDSRTVVRHVSPCRWS